MYYKAFLTFVNKVSALLRWAAQKIKWLWLACENIRFSSLFVAGDVSRETSPAA